VWINAYGEELSTFTIITTEANDFMARLHNRMPVIVARELEDAWLDPELTKAQDVLDVLSRSTGLDLYAYPVSQMVNRPSIDSQALIQRVE
jgi:putative SOS response-associated peptidase YedK